MLTATIIKGALVAVTAVFSSVALSLAFLLLVWAILLPWRIPGGSRRWMIQEQGEALLPPVLENK